MSGIYCFYIFLRKILMRAYVKKLAKGVVHSTLNVRGVLLCNVCLFCERSARKYCLSL